MRTPTRLFAALVLTLGIVVSSCTGDDPDTSGETTSASPLPTVDVPVEFVPGEWTYANNDVSAAFSWEGGALTVENGSGAELGAPGLYVVTTTQDDVDAEIADTAPISDSGSAELVAKFPPDLQLDDVGLVVLLFGDQNWGAMSPVVAEG